MAFWVPPMSPAKVPLTSKALRACRAGTSSVSGARATPETTTCSLRLAWASTLVAMAGMGAAPSATP